MINDRGFMGEVRPSHKKRGLIFAAIFIFLILGGGYVATTMWYFFQIKQGKKIELNNPSNFTISGSATPLNSADRSLLEVSGRPVRGRKEGAEVVIVEFVDYNCPNCRMVYDDVSKMIAVYASRAKLIIRQFPATSISGHEDSGLLSNIAFCANKQNLFWPIHEYIFSNYDELPHPFSEEYIEPVFGKLGINTSALKNCVSDPNTQREVDSDYFDGIAAGVRGTPTFFINGQKVEGAITFEMWKKYFESLTP